MIYYHPQINQLWIHVIGQLWLRVNDNGHDVCLCPETWLDVSTWNGSWVRMAESAFPEDVEVE